MLNSVNFAWRIHNIYWIIVQSFMYEGSKHFSISKNFETEDNFKKNVQWNKVRLSDCHAPPPAVAGCVWRVGSEKRYWLMNSASFDTRKHRNCVNKFKFYSRPSKFRYSFSKLPPQQEVKKHLPESLEKNQRELWE